MEVDLCFVMDCTSSMESHIEASKECILKVVDYMTNMEPKIKIYVGFCGYRDFCDGDIRIQTFDFTDSYEGFRSYVSSVQATGGGDTPEDVLGGLKAAVDKMKWCNVTRVLFHIGDAPPHGLCFTNANLLYNDFLNDDDFLSDDEYPSDDDYPNGDPNGLTAESVLEKMVSAEIYYFFGKINDTTDKMIRIFRDIIGEFLVFDLGNVGENPEELVSKFFEATCTAVTTAVSHQL